MDYILAVSIPLYIHARPTSMECMCVLGIPNGKFLKQMEKKKYLVTEL